MIGIKKKIENWFCKIHLSDILSGTDWFELNEIIKTFGKYSKPEETICNEPVILRDGNGDTEVEEHKFQVENTNTDYFTVCEGVDGSMNYFYHNIFIRIDSDPKDKVVYLFLKKDNDKWTFSYDSNAYVDFLKPVNTNFHTFIKYETIVHGELICGGHYVEGSWNLYLTKCLSTLIKKIYSLTPERKFNGEYKKIE